jgi:hypothetical protein
MYVWIIVTEFGIGTSSHDPGMPSRFEGRVQQGQYPFKVGSRPGLRGVTAPSLADSIGIRVRIIDWCNFC